MAGTVSVSLHGLTALCRLTAWPDWDGCNVQYGRGSIGTACSLADLIGLHGVVFIG